MKYCIDNDTNRFVWADDANGKGVIYYMKDENNNELPYDFKNIMFEYNGNFYYTFSKTTTTNKGVIISIEDATQIDNTIKRNIIKP